ncbi:MAG TPA: RDD family protein [Acidimicrobiales bacterium]|nr:RDD family protein [Acidimicrobiales bacterium]
MAWDQGACPPGPGQPERPALAGHPEEPPLDPLGRPMAEWWRRALAYLVDSVLVAVPVYLVFFPGLGLRLTTTPRGVLVNRPHLLAAFYLASPLLLLAYLALADGSPSGQSLGKRLAGIACRDARHGGPLGYPRAFFRRLVFEALFVLLVPGLVNVVLPLVDRRRQALHDKAAASVVVQVSGTG